MSIATELEALVSNKAAIKSAIIAKNPSIAPTDALAQWPNAIASIPSGGGEEWDGVQWKARFNNKLEDWPKSSQSISFNLGSVSGTIDWGDGSSTSASASTTYSHTYTVRGVYLIVITPTSASPYSYNASSMFAIVGIEEVWIPKNLNITNNNQSLLVFNSYCIVHLPKSGISGTVLGFIINAHPDNFELVSASSTIIRYATPATRNTTIRKLVLTSQNISAGSYATKEYYDTFNGIVFIEFTGVKIFTCGSWDFQKFPQLCKIIGLDTIRLTNGQGVFRGDSALGIVPDLDMITNNVSSCASMFEGCSNLVNSPLGINTSKCTTVNKMFYNCSSLKTAPQNLNLSVCTNVSDMFSGCSAMTTLPETITANPNNALTISFPSTNINIDTLAEFDANEDIIGGLVYGLNDNTSAASAWTISFAAAVKTALEAQHPGGWDKVKAMANAKNWNISPA